MGNRIPAGWGFPAAVAIVSLLAVGLRLFRLDRDELWFDESFAALLAMEPTSTILVELARDSSPPLYFLLLRSWSLGLGTDPVTLRLFSVVCGVLGVWAILRLGFRLWGASAGLAASTLLALSPLHVYYSREVRPYALFILLVILSVTAIEALGRRSWGRALALYSLATLAAIYTHNYGLFLPALLGLWILLGRVAFRTGLAAALIIVAGYLPWLPVLFSQVTSGATLWMERLWLDTPPALGLVKSFATLCIGGWTPEYLPLGSGRPSAGVHLVAYITFALLVCRALLGGEAGTARKVAAAALILLGLPFLVSFFKPLYLVGRHDVIALPLFLLLAARGATVLAWRERLVVALVIGALAATALAHYYSRPASDQARRQASLLLEHATPRDRILFTGFTRNTVEYYLRQGGGHQRLHSFPTSFALHRGWVDERELQDPAFLAEDADRLTQTIRNDMIGAGGQLWIVHSRQLAAANEALMRHIETRLRQVICPAESELQGLTCWAVTDM